MYRKNTAGQFVGFQLVLTATGAFAGGLSPAVRRCIDGTFAAGGGTVTEDNTGSPDVTTGRYKYAMSQADTNGNNISFWFTAATAIPVCVNIVTTAADPTDSVRLGLTALPNAAAGANGGLPLSVDTSGRVDVLKINGTSQTARDIGASVLLSSGTGAGQLSITSGIAKVDVDTIKTNPVVNGGTITFPTGATLASTTNITSAAGVALAAGQKVDVDTIKTNPVVNGGTITFPTGATLASTTNITAGTIATVTNLTNAPTNGDLTTTMKTSVEDAVWDAVIANHLDVGSTGASLNAAGSAGDAWLTPIPGTYLAGTAGHRLGNIPDVAAGAAGGVFIAGTNAATTITTALTTTFTGNITGSVGSVGSNGIVAGSFAADAITASAIATDAFGALEIAAGAATEIAAAVWDLDATAHQTQGTFGQVLGDSGSDSSTVWGLANTNLDATVSSRMATFSYTAPDNTGIASVQAQTDKLAFTVTNQVDANVIDWKGATAPAMTGDAFARIGAAGAGLTALGDTRIANLDGTISGATSTITAAIPSANSNADALLDRTAGVETNRTLRQSLRLMLSALAGKASGLATTTAVYRDSNDSKDRITATVDADGNRSAVTYNTT